MENINFESDFPVTDKEQKEYIEMAKKLAKKHCEDDNPVIDSVKLTSIGGDKKHCKLSYHTNEEKFERIRRITGYLVGTVDRWNDAKQAELHDRVKHA